MHMQRAQRHVRHSRDGNNLLKICSLCIASVGCKYSSFVIPFYTSNFCQGSKKRQICPWKVQFALQNYCLPSQLRGIPSIPVTPTPRLCCNRVVKGDSGVSWLSPGYTLHYCLGNLWGRCVDVCFFSVAI